MVERAFKDFLDQLRVFADTNGFALATGQTSPDPTHIRVQLWRDDIKGIGINTSDSGSVSVTYSIFLYRNCNAAVPVSNFDEVVAALHKKLADTEGITSGEEKESGDRDRDAHYCARLRTEPDAPD